MPIKTAVDLLDEINRAHPDLLSLPDTGAHLLVDLRRASGRPVPEPAAGVPVGPPVMARVDMGRWIGDCDLQDPIRKRACRAAQYLHPDDRRFYCSTCANVAISGRWRLVVWPANRVAIEASMDGLPPREQNWRP